MVVIKERLLAAEMRPMLVGPKGSKGETGGRGIAGEGFTGAPVSI